MSFCRTALFPRPGDFTLPGMLHPLAAAGHALRTLVGLLVCSWLLTTSAEIAHPFTQRLPSLWWAAFVDAGNAADDWGALKAALWAHGKQPGHYSMADVLGLSDI